MAKIIQIACIPASFFKDPQGNRSHFPAAVFALADSGEIFSHAFNERDVREWIKIKPIPHDLFAKNQPQKTATTTPKENLREQAEHKADALSFALRSGLKDTEEPSFPETLKQLLKKMSAPPKVEFPTSKELRDFVDNTAPGFMVPGHVEQPPYHPIANQGGGTLSGFPGTPTNKDTSSPTRRIPTAEEFSKLMDSDPEAAAEALADAADLAMRVMEARQSGNRWLMEQIHREVHARGGGNTHECSLFKADASST